MAEICADASFTLKLVLDEPERPRVRRQWAAWSRSGHRFIVPRLWEFESHSILRLRVYTGELAQSDALDAWRILLSQGIEVLHPLGLFEHAWDLAGQLSRPRTYDMTYLALANLRGCDFWTADRRLRNAAAGRAPRLHYIEELP